MSVSGAGSWFTGWHPPAGEWWKVAERAEFLLRLQPRLPCNLIGHNCEIIANMCVSGGWTGSYQARRCFAVRAVTDASVMFWVASRGLAKLPVQKWLLPVVAAGALASVEVKFTCEGQVRRFWGEIRDDWAG